MKILLTNDDGIEAPGLQALIQTLEGDHEILVVAPAVEKSASSHSISLGQEFVVEEIGAQRFAVHGTPADCVKFALSELKNFRPDLLISGINPGPNTGVSVYYSGTISAAREGLINGVPALAVSVGSKISPEFSYACSFVQMLLEGYEQGDLPRDILLNVNIPSLPESEIRGVKVARQAASRFVEEFILESITAQKRVYSLAGEIEVFDPDGTTDEEVLKEGFVAVTPLKLDQTEYSVISNLEKWAKKRGALWPSPKGI